MFRDALKKYIITISGFLNELFPEGHFVFNAVRALLDEVKNQGTK